MKSVVVAIISILLTCASVKAYSCGGLLEADAGELQFPIEGNAEGESNCLWIIKLLSGNGIRFTLNKLGSAGVVSLYPEHEASETILTPIRLEAASVNSTILATGKLLIVTLSKSSTSSGVSFTWESDAEGNTGSVRAASYVDTPEGRVSFSKFGQAERLTFGLGVDPSTNLKIHATTDFGRCNLLDPCMCTYFALYEVTPEGYLREATRVCGRPSEAVIENLYSQLVAFIYVNTTGAQDPTASVEFTWVASGSDEVTTTTTVETTTTETAPPAQQLECGGVVNLDYRATNPEVFYVEYKLDTIYESNEFCVWTISSTGDVWTDLEVNLVEDDFERAADGLDSYYLYFESSQTSRLEKCSFSTLNRTCLLHNGVSFLAFSSDNSASRRGFRAALAPYGIGVGRRSSFHFAETQVEFNYPLAPASYGNYERVSMVFQQYGPNYVDVTYLDTEALFDALNVFTIYPYYNGSSPHLDGTYSGTFFSDIPGGLTYSSTPRIATFHSDGSTVKQGFRIAFSSEPESQTTEAPLPPVQQLDCGGVINIDYISASPEVFYVEYKLDTLYDDNEFCVWTINSTGSIWDTLEVTLIEEGFEQGRDGLDTYYLDFESTSSSTLGQCTLSGSNSTCTLRFGAGFIAFSSDQSTRGSGFQAALTPHGARTEPHSYFHFAEPEIVFNYPVGGGNYLDDDRVSMVFQHYGPNSLEITRLETESNYDRLYVYTIYPHYNGSAPQQDGAYTGAYPDGRPGSLSFSNTPRIAIFHSDGSNTARGFEITFRREPESGTTEPPTTVAPVEQLKCGGVINITVDDATYVEYKADSYYSNDEFCIWTVESSTGWERATVTVESESFEECCDGIEVYHLSLTSSLNANINKIRLSGTNDSAVLQNGVGFVAFSTDATGVGRGFRLRIEATPPIVANRNETTFFLDDSKGTFQYPEEGIYRPNDRVLTVLQLTKSNNVSITFLNTENGYDFVRFFTIPRFADDAVVIYKGPWSGSYLDGPENSLTTASSPQVVLFTSDGSNQYNGFEIEWEVDINAKEVQTNKSKRRP